MARSRQVLFRDAAYADARSPRLVLGLSLLVRRGRIAWIRPTGDEPRIDGEVEIVDASGTTIVPGMVDAHSHLTLPGGARFLERALDDPDQLRLVAEHNAALQRRAGVRWARDVGAPRGPVSGSDAGRAANLDVRDRWRGRRGYPYVRAGGTWISPTGFLPPDVAVDVADADALADAACQQLDDGADFVKLMLDGPDPEVPPWTVGEVRRVVGESHARGALVAAHATTLAGATVAVEAGADSIEHGLELDERVASLMAAQGTWLVTTLSVYRSWASFARTTRFEIYTAPDGQARTARLAEMGAHSVKIAHRHGVRIAAGTDFGGGSPRANHLAWEVEALVAAGLEPWEALAAATWRGGELLAEPDAGVLREGGPADFFLVHGDPLSDPSSLWRVWRVAW